MRPAPSARLRSLDKRRLPLNNVIDPLNWRADVRSKFERTGALNASERASTRCKCVYSIRLAFCQSLSIVNRQPAGRNRTANGMRGALAVAVCTAIGAPWVLIGGPIGGAPLYHCALQFAGARADCAPAT